MRLLKQWMKAKKGICSSDCECLTITWRRCYAEQNLCNCWVKPDDAQSQPNDWGKPIVDWWNTQPSTDDNDNPAPNLDDLNN